jgi:hypothetical protein
LNSYQRIKAIFEHGKTDKVPVYHLTISSKVASAIMGYPVYVGGGIQAFRECKARFEGEEAHKAFLQKAFEDACKLAEVFEMDIVRPAYWRGWKKPSKMPDEHTMLFGDPGKDKDWQVMELDPNTELFQVTKSANNRQVEMEDLYKQVDEEEKSISSFKFDEKPYDFYIKALKKYGKERAVWAGGNGIEIPYDPAIWLEAVLIDERLVERLLELQCVRAVKTVEAMTALGFEFFRGGGDAASNLGPFYSKNIFDKLMLPRLKRISDACRRGNAYHLFSSDGNLWAWGDSLFKDSGIEGLCEVDRNAGMDLKLLRERYPHLTLFGNISSITLHTGTPEQVERETRECLETAKKHGSICAGVSNIIMTETPLKNVEAMLKVIRTER